MDYLTNLNLNKNELQNAVIQNLSVAPSNPKAGQIYYNSTDKMIYQFDGTNWVSFGGQIDRLSANPANPKTNQVYYNTTDNVLKQYTGSAWVDIANYSAGTVTSVQVQATSPVQSSVSTAQSSSLSTTISLADAYGDTKNPYGAKSPNYVLAGPSSGSSTAAPSFRALVATDIPNTVKVGSASFADDSTSNASSPIKLTIKDSQTTASNLATANIPKVSSSSAGVLPKVTGNTNSTKVASTDYVWDATQGDYRQLPSTAFSDNNTTYTFENGTNGFTVTPSGGSAQTVTVTPSITNNVTYSGTLTDDHIPVFDSTSGAIEDSGKTITTTAPASGSTDNATVPTSAAVATAISNAVSALPEPMVFKGSVGSGGTVEWSALPAASSSNEGFTYKVITAHDTAPICEVGDTIISDGSTWTVIPSGDEPSGTVTSVGVQNATNGGLSVSGSPITSSGTITIGLDTAYGDTKNPYGSKTKNYVLAAPSNANGVPSFRALVSGDIPSLGNIQNTGALQTTDVTIDNGDKLIITDSSDSNKVARSSTSFDGSTTTQYLSKKGTFESPATTVSDGEGKPVTSGAVYSYVQGLISGSVYKISATNPALTASGSAFIWTITNSLGNSDISVNVYKVSTGEKVIPDITVETTSPYNIVITINDTESAESLSAGTYKAVIMG